ncbi:hypothetical protein [Bacteroides caccae]|uniref:hypothetical protein n=1 Tax=Bacteroides caccae TaxID=47678 RepID=UPI001864AD74
MRGNRGGAVEGIIFQNGIRHVSQNSPRINAGRRARDRPGSRASGIAPFHVIAAKSARHGVIGSRRSFHVPGPMAVGERASPVVVPGETARHGRTGSGDRRGVRRHPGDGAAILTDSQAVPP